MSMSVEGICGEDNPIRGKNHSKNTKRANHNLELMQGLKWQKCDAHRNSVEEEIKATWDQILEDFITIYHKI